MSGSIDRLVAWIREAGGHVGPLVVATRGGERGVYAGEALEAGVPLVVVPAACFVTTDVAADTPPGRWIAARFDGASVEQVLLAAWIVHLRHAPDARWAPYLATLPTRLPTHPFFYDDADRRALRGTSLETLLPARRTFLMDELGWLRETVPEAARWDDAEWLLARTLVTSRLFGLGGEVGNGLVPFADLCNHALTAETTWGLEAAGFVLRAGVGLPAGGEVHESYGPKSNLRLLLHYGFTLAENPEEDCIVDVEGQPVQLGARPDADTVREVVEGLAWDGDVRRVAEAFGAVCRARLAALPRPDDDAADGATPNGRDAVRVRQAERRVLEAWLAAM